MPAAMRLVRLALLALVLLAGCDAQRAVCEDNCEKRAECKGDVDVDQCQEACDSERPGVSEACLEADVTYQQCLVELSCDDYVASKGCEAELEATTEACRP
jgi:hypothetical protein